MGDGFYRSKDPTNSIKVLKEHIVHRHIKHTISRHKHKNAVPLPPEICRVGNANSLLVHHQYYTKIASTANNTYRMYQKQHTIEYLHFLGINLS